MFYFFATSEPIPYLQSGPAIFILIGPSLFLYVLSVKQPESRLVKQWIYHLGFWVLLALTMYIFYPFKDHVNLWKEQLMFIIYMQWICYLISSIFVIRKEFFQVFSKDKKGSVVEKWLLSLLFGNIVLWAIYFLIDYNYFIIGPIAFSMLFYSFFLFFLYDKKKASLVFAGGGKYVDKRIQKDVASQLISQLDTLLMEGQMYKNPSLKSSDLAELLNISTHQFSQLLNDNLGKNFSVFINEYRIEEAKQLIRSNTRYSLDAIGNESGFNSKSTFFTTFKRMVGITPATYKQQF
ncbi:MAG: helix-turn-helix domain-containing protein [Bacteroidota bacterium]